MTILCRGLSPYAAWNVMMLLFSISAVIPGRGPVFGKVQASSWKGNRERVRELIARAMLESTGLLFGR